MWAPVVSLEGTRADQPAAGVLPVGTLWKVTDEAGEPVERDDGTTWSLFAGGSSAGIVNTVAASGTTLTLDLANGDWHDVTLTADCTFTFAGATAGQGDSFLLILRQDGTGGRTVTWPASVSWPDDTAPTLSTDPNDVDMLAFFTRDGGVTWFGTYHGGGAVITSLDDLSDVTITSPATYDQLQYDGSGWVNTGLIWKPLLDADGAIVTDGDGDPTMGLAPA